MSKRYVIMVKNAVTEAQMNKSTSNTISDARISNDRLNVVLEFEGNDSVAQQQFINEHWMSQRDVSIEMEKSEWTPS